MQPPSAVASRVPAARVRIKRFILFSIESDSFEPTPNDPIEHDKPSGKRCDL